MNRKTLYVVTALVVLIGAIVVFAVPAGSQQPQQRTTLTFFDPNRTNWEKFVDVGRGDFSPGDTILFVDAQFDPETCDRVGTLVGRLTISRLLGRENAWTIGDFTLKLPAGKIMASGAAKFAEFDQTERAVFAVTGGTDAYRDVSGDVSIQEDVRMCDRKGALVTIDTGPQP